MMDKFWELFRESVITSSILAITLVGGTVILVATGKVVPDWLIVATSTVIGFFFAQKQNPKPPTAKG